MEIHFLGTGSAYPGVVKDNTSICLSLNENHILIDASGNPCKKLKQLSISLEKISSVIITHFHIDHIYGLPSLLWGMWLENRKETLTIYVDYRNEEKLHEWLRTMDIWNWGIAFLIQVKTFNGDQLEKVYEDNNLEISCFKAIHSVPTIGLEIRFQDKTIIYSGDSEINPHIRSYDDIDVLIHEATSAKIKAAYHTSLKEIKESYELNNIQKIVAIHLSDNEPYEEVAASFPKGKLIIAEDMTSTCL
jgi:ribonuclease Z